MCVYIYIYIYTHIYILSNRKKFKSTQNLKTYILKKVNTDVKCNSITEYFPIITFSTVNTFHSNQICKH